MSAQTTVATDIHKYRDALLHIEKVVIAIHAPFDRIENRWLQEYEVNSDDIDALLAMVNQMMDASITAVSQCAGTSPLHFRVT